MHQRIDIYPTHHHGDFLLRSGRPYPFGASFVPGGVNFAIFSRHATACTLVLYRSGEPDLLAEIPFPTEFRIGNVFAMVVFGLDYENVEYGYRLEGPFRPHAGHHFDPDRIVVDPYARALSGGDSWAQRTYPDSINPHRGRLVYDDFDWLADRPLEHSIEDLVIYEMHVRGFTRHASSGVRFPGTYAGIREKIPYLKELGINAVELMPVMEFDELDNTRVNPLSGDRLYDYWGYNPIAFFAPKAGYAATGHLGMQADELKALVKDLHRHGIEVLLDVVFNHTGEGNEEGRTISFRGIDNKTYYMLKPDGGYYNFSGCGNTLNCNNPVVRNMVLDCLRYWVAEFHIDGFRFDLASIMGRDSRGQPLINPPLLEALAHDPVLGRTKLIAEAWDAGGLYQVGSFPSYGRWAEWNGQYRDTLRRWLKGDMGQVQAMALRIMGSPDLYPERGPAASINFITCHDGFTLTDLFSYNEKHNEANGEGNRDGHDANFSWNCGWEGETASASILALRRRMMKNAILILMVSQGVPLISMGDELAHTAGGNNNTYCHDNELNWLDWSRRESQAEIFRFFRLAIARRGTHAMLRQRHHLRQREFVDGGYPDISWHGVQAWQPDWSHHARTLAFMLAGQNGGESRQANTFIYVAMNMHWDPHRFELPRLPARQHWHLVADTHLDSPEDIHEPGEEPLLRHQKQFQVGPRSVIMLIGR